VTAKLQLFKQFAAGVSTANLRPVWLTHLAESIKHKAVRKKWLQRLCTLFRPLRADHSWHSSSNFQRPSKDFLTSLLVKALESQFLLAEKLFRGTGEEIHLSGTEGAAANAQ
jgi:hypothetical protein